MSLAFERERDMPTRVITSRWFLPLCLLTGLVLRLAWVFSIDARPVDDFSWYHDRAVDLSEGKGLVDQGRPTAYWPVGYPAMLGALYAVTGPSVRAAQAANIVLSLAILVMAWWLGRRITGSEVAARLGMALLAVWPNQIAYTSLTATEIPFVFLLLLGVVLWIQPRAAPARSLAAGLVFGLATLVRPQAVLLPLFMGVWWWLASGRPRPTWRALAAPACLHLGLVLALVPWTLRNDRVFGEFVFVANSGGINLYIGNNPRATGGYMEVPEILVASGELERDRLAARLARQYILGHPFETFARLPAKLWHLYHKDVEGFYWNEMAMGRGDGAAPQRPLWPLKLAAQAYWVGLLACALAGLGLLALRGAPGPPGPAAATAGWAVIAYFTLVFLALFGSTRFHFPMAPFLAIQAAACLAPARARRAAPAAAEPVQHGATRGVPAGRPL
jgi:hypothetical protein